MGIMHEHEAIFLSDAGRFVPTPLACGPWTPTAQHGGPPAALLARAVARHDGGNDDMLVVRLTVELLRPVPLTPLEVRTTTLRPGRKVQIVGASLHAGDTEVARATGLRMRRATLVLPHDLPAAPTLPPGPDRGAATLPPWSDMLWGPAFHRDGVEHRFVAGSFERPGAATDWIRLRVPLVAGEPTLPISRVAAAADFGNGVSWVLSRNDGYEFINPDLTIYVHRPPVGEWVCIEAVTYPQPHGVGLAESRLWDESGMIGRSVQSLLLDRR
jgi:hypothetical protein